MGIIFCIVLVLLFGGGQAASPETEDGIFGGKVDHVNEGAKLLRIHTKALNAKYLSRGDRVSLGDYGGMTECKGDVVGRAAEHLLLRLSQFRRCSRNLPIMVRGAWLRFYGLSLAEKVAKGRKLVEILLKKRLALLGKLGEGEKEMKKHGEKIEIINKKYGVLRDKVVMEWQDALGELDGDRLRMVKKREEYEKRLTEVNRQLERYRVEDKIWELDRWSLDRQFYFKK